MERLNKIVEMLLAGRIGFKMDEVMTGTHRFEPGYGPEGEHPLEFKVTWGPLRLSDIMASPMKGTITIDGLCEDEPCYGILEFNYFTEQTLRYTLNFSADEKRYQYIGEKRNIKPWNLPVSHTTCYGKLREKGTGNLVSKSVTYFRLRTLPAFIASFRFE